MKRGLILFVNPDNGKFVGRCPGLGENVIRITRRVFQTAGISPMLRTSAFKEKCYQFSRQSGCFTSNTSTEMPGRSRKLLGAL